MKRPSKQPLNIIFSILCYGLALVAGYGATKLIYRFTGEPPVVLTYVFCGFAAIIFVMLVFGIIGKVSGTHRKVKNIHENLKNAMEQISQGNFDVVLDPEQGFEHHELVEAINDMAQSLGTLETMRQDFISNVSHEIQSPLTSIGGFAVLLKNPNLPQNERLHYAGIIEAESKRLSGLSENLLKLSSLDDSRVALNRRAFRLDKQLESVALTLEPLWSAKKIDLDVSLRAVTLDGDAELLSQVWINLLHNAIKFTPDLGKVSIGLTSDGDAATVTVSDTGVGIARSDQMHIFERFYKVDKARDRSLGGNGLGLSLAKKIVELHSGRIAVLSVPDSGTTFTVTLPQ
jgi:signal transduction histidine kinase